MGHTERQKGREKERDRESGQAAREDLRGNRSGLPQLKDQTQRDGFLHDVSTSEGQLPHT